MTEPHETRFPWHLDWNLLRSFMVIVEQRGISRAAQFMGLKQPTVSAALKRLEQTMGATLIIRKPNEFTVTSAGQVLYSECAKIFGTVSQLPSILSETTAELRGHITIAITSSVISPHFDAVLSAFCDRHPNVTYSFAVHESDDVQSMVEHNRASFGICLLSSMPQHLKTVLLYREYFGLYCGPLHPLFDAETIAITDLEHERFVSFQTETEGGPLEAVSRLRSSLKLSTGWRGGSSSLNEIRRMIIANVGIGALPVHVAKSDVAAGLLRQLPPFEGLPLLNIHFLQNPARRQSEAEQEFLSELQQQLKITSLKERTYGA